MIFVVDCTEKERFKEAKQELWTILNNEDTTGVHVLLYSNKEDLSNGANCIQVTDQLDLPKIYNHNWHIQSTSALSGKGIFEGMDWLIKTMETKLCGN